MKNNVKYLLLAFKPYINSESWNQYRDKIKSLNINNDKDIDILFANC